MLRVRKGQSILEYAILMGVIVAVIVVIQIYVKRAVQGNLKSRADQIGEQFTTGQAYTVQKISQTARVENRLVGDANGTTTTGTDGSTTSSPWEQSKIQTKDEANVNDWLSNLGTYAKKGTDYKGAEVNVTDYVTSVSGTDTNANLGEHSAMDSGILKNKGLFKDDE